MIGIESGKHFACAAFVRTTVVTIIPSPLQRLHGFGYNGIVRIHLSTWLVLQLEGSVHSVPRDVTLPSLDIILQFLVYFQYDTNVLRTRGLAADQPVLGRAIKRGWASHQTRLGRAIKRGWGEPVLRDRWASQLLQPPQQRLLGAVPARHCACSARLVKCQLGTCPLGTVPARHI